MKGNIGFQGKFYDQESGLYYCYHRYYHPGIGRFTTEDPIGFEGGINLYRFVENNPVNKRDYYWLWTGITGQIRCREAEVIVNVLIRISFRKIVNLGNAIVIV